MKRLVQLLGLAALVALGSDRALTGAAGQNGGGDRWQFRLRLSAPEPSIQRDPAHPELGPVLTIPTFDRILKRAEAGFQASLPVKVVRVAIPEGAAVSLESIRAERRLLKGVRPGSAEVPGSGKPGTQAGPTPTAGEAPIPDGSPAPAGGAAGPIRLGQIGYIRFQKFVEVIYSPLHPIQEGPEAGEDLEFYPEVEADLVVSGVDVQSLERGDVVADPHFEQSYRRSFLNYEEGRKFRTRPAREGGGVTAATRSSDAISAPGAPAGPIVSPFANAITPVYRVVIKSNGIYRLTQPYLDSFAPALISINPQNFRMLNRGVEVPLRVVGEGDGVFNLADFIEFYGEGMLGEPELLLNYDVSDPNGSDVYQANDFTDENVYFLFGEAGTHARIPDLSGAFDSLLAQEGSFLETIHKELDTRHGPNGVDDPFVMDPFLGGNNGTFVPDPNAVNCGYVNNGGVDNLAKHFGPASDPNRVSCGECDLGIIDPDPNAGSFTAMVRARLRGATGENVNPDHMTVLQVGTDSPSTRSSTLCFDGEGMVLQSVSVPQSVLAGGAGIYIGQPGLLATMNEEFLYLDYIEADYRRLLKLNGNALRAGFTNAARTYNMAGFPNATAADVIVYDVSRKVSASTVPSPRRIINGNLLGMAPNVTFQFSLQADGTLPPGANRVFVAAGTGGFKTPLRIEERSTEDLVDTANAADMLIITTQQVVGAVPSSIFTNYLAHREADSGITTKVVMMEDIYDYFSDGVETPEALRSFLAYAVDNWATSPSYVMLVGDTSLDYKNDINDPDWINQVPTFIMYEANFILDFYASDTYISAFMGGDQLPDIHLGRVPVRNPAQADIVFQKMLDYDTNAPVGAWRSTGLFLADAGNNPGETSTFEEIESGLADTYFVPPFTAHKLFYDDPNYISSTPPPDHLDPNLWRNDYRLKADAGAALTSFVGHGAFDDWGRDGLLKGSDLASFAANQKPSFIVNENCLAGGFHGRGGDALGEVFLKVQGKGAIAVFAPAGLSFATFAIPANDSLFGDMFGLFKERRFGPLVTNIKLVPGLLVTDIQNYTFLGDPAQRLILPAPRPPTGFAATSGLDAQVLLTWSPGPDPGVKTRIYRTEIPGTPYTLLNPAGTAGTSYTDLTAINGKAYFYRAVSVDPNGVFEGAVTNTGADCVFSPPEDSGMQCVWAKPINPNPPSAPGNFRVLDPGTGNTLNVSWLITDPDISGYTVRFGTVSGGPYPNTRLFPAGSTGGSIPGVTLGVTYYFVATASNTSGLTSAMTPERSGTPTVFEGVNAPDIIGDLDLRRSAQFPDSVELLWTPPSEDIHGNPTQLSSFTIYRDTFPTFTPSGGNTLITINDPSAGSFVDSGAYSLAQPSYYYLVGSRDTDGFSSGIGRQLPDGISSLNVMVNGGNLAFTWPPVLLDVDGNLTQVSHYVLYADPQPVGRARIDSLTPLVPSIGGTSIGVPMPPGALVYYSVIVVDIRGNKSPF